MSRRSPLEAVWLVPAGLASLGFYKCAGRFFRLLRRLHLRRHPGQGMRWSTLSGETIARPLALPMISADGRWNTHAIVGVVGPVAAERRLTIRVASAWSSASSWTIGVNRFSGYRPVVVLGSSEGRTDEEWRSVEVTPGRYMLLLRYYGWGRRVELPEVRVDDGAGVPAREVPADTNAFYRSLAARSHAFYRCLHFYVYPMLRYAHLLPPRWVERELLPVGNPETRFYYGCVDPGEAVSIDVGEELNGRANVYYTLYDLQSFPLEWCQVPPPRHRGSPAPSRGFYVVRVHPLDRAPAVDGAGVAVSVGTP